MSKKLEIEKISQREDLGAIKTKDSINGEKN
jgi:hypothetical protein